MANAEMANAEMANAETGTDVSALTVVEQVREVENTRPAGQSSRDLMAPGHLYNPRTGTGIEWLSASLGSEEPGRVRLWSRQWNGKPHVLAEAEHQVATPWEYWYSLEFANSFPQVTHWWFGDAWTGYVRIWKPDVAGVDPESGAPMLMGWMRFGIPDIPGGADEDASATTSAAQPWTVVITNPPRINLPLPPLAASLANLPLQLLLGKNVMALLGKLATERPNDEDLAHNASPDVEVVLTSLVRRDDLQRAFPIYFGSWRLDRLPDLTPREALCRVQGLEPIAFASSL